MTVQPNATYQGGTQQYMADRAAADAAAARLATRWGVGAVGRHEPVGTTRRGFRVVRQGRWYVVRSGERLPATTAQSRALRGCGMWPTYSSIGPIAAI